MNKLDLYDSNNKHKRTLVMALDTLEATKALLEDIYSSTKLDDQIARLVEAGVELCDADTKLVKNVLGLE